MKVIFEDKRVYHMFYCVKSTIIGRGSGRGRRERLNLPSCSTVRSSADLLNPSLIVLDLRQFEQGIQ
jgi:hypothetical protein